MKKAKLEKGVVIHCPYCYFFFAWDNKPYKFSPNIECEKCKQFFNIDMKQINKKINELKE